MIPGRQDFTDGRTAPRVDDTKDAGKVRVYQVAKDLGLTNKELVTKVQSLGIEVKNHMSSLDLDDVQRVKRALEKERQESLVEERLSPTGVLARHDVRARALEGLDQEIKVLRGEVPQTVLVRDHEREYEVDLRRGQKTGRFLDQRENRSAAAGYARGRLLDCFSYDGGFALELAARCTEAIALDISEEAVARIARNAERNGLRNVRATVANAFDFLREAERAGERFDTIVLDPPGFARNRAALPRALGGYKEINLRALKMLNPGGTLVTCSCSYPVSEELLLEVVQAAALDARAVVSLMEKRMQSRDHPVLIGVPETHYLKCLILRKLEV